MDQRIPPFSALLNCVEIPTCVTKSVVWREYQAADDHVPVTVFADCSLVLPRPPAHSPANSSPPFSASSPTSTKTAESNSSTSMLTMRRKLRWWGLLKIDRRCSLPVVCCLTRSVRNPHIFTLKRNTKSRRSRHLRLSRTASWLIRFGVPTRRDSSEKCRRLLRPSRHTGSSVLRETSLSCKNKHPVFQCHKLLQNFETGYLEKTVFTSASLTNPAYAPSQSPQTRPRRSL